MAGRMSEPTPKKTDDKRLTPAFLAQAGKGRPKGVPNKATSLAKNVIAEVGTKLGGADRMLAWVQEAPENERLFWGTIYPKLLPLQVTGGDEGDAPISIVVRKVIDA